MKEIEEEGSFEKKIHVEFEFYVFNLIRSHQQRRVGSSG